MLFVLAGLCAAHDSVDQRLSELTDEIEALQKMGPEPQDASAAEQQDLEEDWFGKSHASDKTAVVDVHICAAIPILEKWAGYCGEKPMEKRFECLKQSLAPNVGHLGGPAERILLSQLLGVLLLSSGSLTNEEKLLAYDWLSTDFDLDGLDNFMRGKVSKSSQEGMEAAQNTLGCMAEVGKTVATLGILERNVVTAEGSSDATAGESSVAVTQEDNELEREVGTYTSCIALLVQVAEAVAGTNGRSWSASDAWRVQGAVALQHGALDETNVLLKDMRGLDIEASQSTLLAVKQVLCVLTLYDAYFAAKDGLVLETKKPVKGTKETYAVGEHKRKLELARVKQGTFMASVTSYREKEQIELVETMSAELERLYMVLTQAIQREGMRINIKTQTMLKKLMKTQTLA